jgi:N utilization substance protein A
MNLDLVSALNELEKERGISKEILFEAIESAVISAYKRNYGNTLNVRVDINDRSGDIRVFARKDVVDEVLDEPNEISLEDAKKINPSYELDDIVEIEVTPKDFGRIAAQTAKQVVIQRIREAERALVYEEFSNREGDIVTGIVQRHEHRNVMIDLGKIEAVLPPGEQTPNEIYNAGNRLKVYVCEVKKTTKGPQVLVSRGHAGLLKRLFELEVPEIHDGVVEIRAVAREAGSRSKIAVYSKDRNVDPVGACVGPRGMRVQTIVQELKGEKIDIIPWDPLPERFIANALSPSKVVRVIADNQEKSARAVVPDNHLSLAIGKEGQNARLAARLTGWKIDIKSESQIKELISLEALRPKERVIISEVTEETLDSSEQASKDMEKEEKQAALLELIEEAELDDEMADQADFDADENDEETVNFDQDEDYRYTEEIPDTLEEPVKPKKRKGEKRRGKEDIMLEDISSEEEPLPSLFTSDEEESQVEVEVMSTPEIKVAKPKRSKAAKENKEGVKSKAKNKKVIKDLSELANLVDMKEKE